MDKEKTEAKGESHTEIGVESTGTETKTDPVPTTVVAPNMMAWSTKRHKVDLWATVVLTSGKLVEVWAEEPKQLYLESPFKTFKVETEWTEPDSQMITVYRQECSRWVAEAGLMVTDRITARKLLLVNHLKEIRRCIVTGKQIGRAHV